MQHVNKVKKIYRYLEVSFYTKTKRNEENFAF